MAFKFSGRSVSGGKPQTIQLEMEPSTTLAAGDPCIVSATGKIKKCAAQDDEPLFISAAAQTSTATGGETGLFFHAGKNDLIWTVGITPLINRSTGLASGSTTVAKITNPDNASANDFRGGTIASFTSSQIANNGIGTGAASTPPASGLQMNTKNQARISASSSGSGPFTMDVTVITPWNVTTVGGVFSITPLGPGVVAAKLKATDLDTITQVKADLTGGHLRVIDVDLNNNTVDVLIV